MKTTRRTLPTGCIFDGCHGQEYNDQRVIALAKEYGWEQPEPSEDMDELENKMWDVSDASSYLEQFAPDGYYVAWENGGDFGVWEDEQEPETDENGNTNMRCNRCEAMMIQGIYTHEHGCPNRNKVKIDNEWVEDESDYDEHEFLHPGDRTAEDDEY